MSDLKDNEILILKAAITEEEWDRAVDEIVRSHGGQYPANWYEVVIVGKIIPDPTIRIVTIERKDL